MVGSRDLGHWVWGVSLLVPFLAGCSDADMGQVSGTVRLDDQPLANALVTFTPLEGGRPASARTDGNGHYELVFSRDVEGAPVGKHSVAISSFAENVAEDGTVEIVPEKVPVQYNLDTELVAEVTSGSNQFDFDLKAEGKVVQPNL